MTTNMADIGSMEQAIKMQQSGVGINKIKATYQKLELKLFRYKKSFVFLAKSLYKIESSG
jgi:hypothetical protein